MNEISRSSIVWIVSKVSVFERKYSQLQQQIE